MFFLTTELYLTEVIHKKEILDSIKSWLTVCANTTLKMRKHQKQKARKSRELLIPIFMYKPQVQIFYSAEIENGAKDHKPCIIS